MAKAKVKKPPVEKRLTMKELEERVDTLERSVTVMGKCMAEIRIHIPAPMLEFAAMVRAVEEQEPRVPEGGGSLKKKPLRVPRG